MKLPKIYLGKEKDGSVIKKILWFVCSVILKRKISRLLRSKQSTDRCVSMRQLKLNVKYHSVKRRIAFSRKLEYFDSYLQDLKSKMSLQISSISHNMI